MPLVNLNSREHFVGGLTTFNPAISATAATANLLLAKAPASYFSASQALAGARA